MMKIILKLIALIGLISFFSISCDDKEVDMKLNLDPNKMVSFAQDTFYFSEDSLNAEISIVVPKYVNGSVQLFLGLENVTAVRDTHFYIDVLEAKIPIGGYGVSIPIEIYDDTLVNKDRSFTLELLEVEGAAYAGLERQMCVVIIENDDFPAQTTAVFSQPEIEVYENKGEIKIPFEILGDLEGDAFIIFGYDKSVGSANQEHFRFRNGGKVLLEKGDKEGFVILDIYNNDQKNDDLWADIYMGEHEGVVVGSKEESTCRLLIKDDDIARTIGFSVARDTALETSKTMEISVLIEGKPKFDKPIITGELYFLGPDSLATNRGLKILGDPRFKVRGDTVLKYTIEIDDNTNFGSWGDSLGFRSLANVLLNSETETIHITIADNERRVYFKEAEYIENENAHSNGGWLKIPICLEGGVALEDIEVRFTTLESTTLEGQYRFLESSNVVTIKKGSDEAEAKVQFASNPSKLDTYFVLGLETDHVATVVKEGSVCKVNIINTDAAVQFSTNQELYAFKDSLLNISITSTNLSEGDTYVELEVINSEGVSSSGYFKTFSLTKDKSTYSFDLSTTANVLLGKVTIRIKSVKHDDGNLDIINPLFNEITIHVVNSNFNDMKFLDRSDWTVVDMISDQGDGFEGENNGAAADAIDNDDYSYWCTNWKQEGTVPATQENPHWIIFDMKKEVLPFEVEFLRRDDHFIHQIKDMKVYIGDSETGPWLEIGHITKNDAEALTVRGDVEKIIGRYVKLESFNVDYTSIAEFKVFGFVE